MDGTKYQGKGLLIIRIDLTQSYAGAGFVPAPASMNIVVHIMDEHIKNLWEQTYSAET